MESSPARSANRRGPFEVESKLKDRRGKTRAAVRTEAGRANVPRGSTSDLRFSAPPLIATGETPRNFRKSAV